MKIVEFDEIRSNAYFWLYFLATAFPLAMDTEEDTDLSDFIYEYYEQTSDASEWIDAFVQYTDGIMEENDGYADDPTSVVLAVENEEYIIQYHPGDTVYLRNRETFASTGPHYDIHKLDFQQFQAITKTIDDFQKAVLLLPVVYIKESEVQEAEALICQLLLKMPVRPEHRSRITDMIIEGIKI